MSSGSQHPLVRSWQEPAPMMSNGFLVLYLGVTPYQNEQLCLGLPAEPDEHSNRFGLRTTARSAILRAHYFMEWTPLGGRGECTLAEMKAYKVVLSPDGYMQKMESGILECRKVGEYRWYGRIAPYEMDHQGRLLYALEMVDYISLTSLIPPWMKDVWLERRSWGWNPMVFKNTDWRSVRRDEKISLLHWVCRWFELCCNCISIESWCYVECKAKRFTRFTLLLMLHFAWTVHVVEIFVEEGVQVVLRRILNEPCSWNLKFNGVLLKPWMFLQCFGSSQSWMWWWSLAEEFLGCSKFSCFPSRTQMSLGFGV